MKIFLLANNIVGLEICKYLKSIDEEIVGLAIHMPEKQKYAKEIIESSQVPKELVFEADQLRDPKIIQKISELKADIAIAAFWGYILKKELFGMFPSGCINFHPGYLPYNRGMNPNVWPIIEGTPGGVTIHLVDEGIDTGPIIARKKMEIEPIDTGGSFYDKTLVEIVKLFKETWPDFKNNKIKAFSQKDMDYTFHYAKDIDKVDEIKLDKKYLVRDLINKLRARTYRDDSYAYFIDKGKKIKIGVFLKYEK